jgi:hypothetical protein
MDINAVLQKQSPIRTDWNASIDCLHMGGIMYSDTEEDTISDVHSFDEDDMYGSDNGDDIIVICPDSEDDVQAALDNYIVTVLESANDIQSSLIGIVRHPPCWVVKMSNTISSLMMSFRK